MGVCPLCDESFTDENIGDHLRDDHDPKMVLSAGFCVLAASVMSADGADRGGLVQHLVFDEAGGASMIGVAFSLDELRLLRDEIDEFLAIEEDRDE